MKSLATARLALALALPLALAGCGGGGGNGSPAPSPSAPAAPPSVSAATPSGLTATLAESAGSIPVNGSVTYTATLVNDTAQPVTVQEFGGNTSGSSLSATVTVRNAVGAIVYPIYHATPVTAPYASPSATLAPGQSVVGTITVAMTGGGDVFTPAGGYSATATFQLYTGPATATNAALAAAQTTTVGPLTVTAQ